MLSILSNQKATPKKVLSTPKRKATSITPKAKKRFFERSDITTSSTTPSEMCSKFGFEAVVLLCFATQHVPIMFPNRLTYIRNIVNSGKRTFTLEEISNIVHSVVSWKDTPWPLSGYSYHRTLWEISRHTSTSHMLFLAPPVDSCLHCGGKVYASDGSSHATVFTLGFGPLPALKCTLRCRECSSRYNICDYRIPNIGTKYYPSNCVTPYVEVSTCTYFEKNVHEFMCESSEAFYRFDDLQNAFCYSQALNNSFGNGGGLFCTLQPKDIIQHCGQLDEDWRSEGNTPKTLVIKPGLQPNSNILVLNPDHYVNTKGENVPVEDCNFVWLPDYPASPSMELAHYINTDTKLEPLRQFVLKAEEVCANNIGPTLLAMSCMYLQCHFKRIMDLVGHYNIPLLYSQHTQVGKTLAASCASNLIGAQNLYSRCTLAYLTGRVTGSTLPFVWDDPSSPSDVAQLAVDLGNGASRGSGPPKTKRGKDNPPTTGCIVTANFSMCNIDRAGTRTVPLMFSQLNKEKQPGEGLELQEMAKEASSAFPLIIGLFDQIKKDTVASQTNLVKKLLPMLDLRLQEGLALPLLYLRLILNELKLYRVMPAVVSYIQNPLFQELSGRPTTDQDESTLNTLITRISTIVNNKDLAEEASDHIRVMPDYIAVRPSEISKLLDMPEDQTRKILNHPGCSRGQVRLQTGNKKCYKVFKNLLTNNVVKKLEEALKLGQVEEEEDDESDDPLAFDMERPADRPAIDEEIDDDEEQQQQDPQPPQQQQQQQPEPHLPEEPLPEIPKKVQQKRKTLTLLPLVVKKKPITNSQRSSSRSSKGVTSKLTDYYI